MNRHSFLIKFVIVVAILSLLLVALAPVIYVFAPSVSVTSVQNAVGGDGSEETH